MDLEAQSEATVLSHNQQTNTIASQLVVCSIFLCFYGFEFLKSDVF